MENRWLQSLNSLPGPLWLFGGYAVVRAGTWLNTTIVSQINGSSFFSNDWMWALMSLQGLVVSLLPLLLFGLVVMRKSYALPLVGWCAVGKALACVAGLLAPILNNPVPMFMTYAELTGSLLRIAGWGVVWVVLMLYVERSQSLALEFPSDARRTLWWAVVLIVALCLTGG